MNTEKLKGIVSGLVRSARENVRNKVVELMEGTRTTPEQLAEVLSIPTDEVLCVLEGEGEISFTTFATLLTATGHVLAIETNEEAMRKQAQHMPTPPRGFVPPHTREMPMGMGAMPPYGVPSDKGLEMPPYGRYPMGEREHHAPTYAKPSRPMDFEHREAPQRPYEPSYAPRSPFADKGFEELKRIIREHLWESEINLATASKEMLVQFLDEKNRKIHEVRRAKSLEEDPKVNAWKQRIKKTVKENPQLDEWIKRYMGDFEE